MPGRIELGSTTPRAGSEFCPIIPKFASLAEVSEGNGTPKKGGSTEILLAAPSRRVESLFLGVSRERFRGVGLWVAPQDFWCAMRPEPTYAACRQVAC